MTSAYCEKNIPMNILEIQKVPASHGWLWIKHGYRLIMRNPLQSISAVMVFALGIFIPALLPVLGVLFAIILMPVWMAGFMRVCRSLEYSEKIESRFILAGFSSRIKQLFAVGAILFLGIQIIAYVVIALGGDALSTILENFKLHQDSNALMETLLAPGSGVEVSLMVGMFLFFGLMMATQFAPMLVFFNQMSARQAVQASLLGTIRNIVPYMAYSLIMQVIALLVSVMPLKLGWLIMLPLGLTSMYVAYRDIFTEVVVEDGAVKKVDG